MRTRYPHTIQWELWPKRIVDAMTDPDNLESEYYVEDVWWFTYDELDIRNYVEEEN